MASRTGRLTTVSRLAPPLLAALAAQSALAQTSRPEATLPTVTVQGARETIYNAPDSSTATRGDVPLRDVPQTVNVVTEELMRDRAVRSMEDALRLVPGISPTHGDGQRDQVKIRGFSAIGDQFVDGVRDDAVYFRDLSNVERVEVVKGPAAVLYGRGSSGGMINRITKKPGVDLNEISLQYGTWKQRRGEFDIARNVDDRLSYRITGALERSDSYRDQQFLHREALSPSAMFKFNADTQLLLQAEYLHDKRVTDFGIPSFQGRPIDVAPGTYYGSGNARDADTSGSKVSAVSATFTHRFNDTWSFRNVLRYYQFELNRRQTSAGAVTANANLALYPSGYQVARSRGGIWRDEHGVFNQAELTQKATLIGMSHQFLYGLELGDQNRRQMTRASSAVPVDAFHPVAPIGSETWTVTPGVTNTGGSTVAAVYLQDLITLTEHWKALVGLRYDSFRQTVDADNIPNRTDKAWSPRAGLVYQPTNDQSYYVSISRSFQPAGESFNLTTANAVAEPQRTTGKEVGARFDLFGGKASAGVALFNLERTNIRSTDPANPLLTIPIGTERTNGLELSLTGDLSDGWKIFAGYAFLDSEVSRSLNPALQGKALSLTPKNAANIWVTKALAADWIAGGGINYVASRFADPNNEVTLPSYTTFDAMVGHRIGGVDLQLNFYNLFDRRYMVSAHSGTPNSLMPGQPRAVTLTARYAF